MILHVYVRGISDTEKEQLTKILTAAGITNYQIRDLAIKDAKSFASEGKSLSIAMGKVCARLVNGHEENLITLPALNQLTPTEKNRQSRQEAWTELTKIKQILEEGNIKQEKSEDWQYAMVYLPDQRTMCIYEKDRPQGVKADVFISRDDSQLLLRIKEAFKAEAVIIEEA